MKLNIHVYNDDSDEKAVDTAYDISLEHGFLRALERLPEGSYDDIIVTNNAELVRVTIKDRLHIEMDKCPNNLRVPFGRNSLLTSIPIVVERASIKLRRGLKSPKEIKILKTNKPLINFVNELTKVVDKYFDCEVIKTEIAMLYKFTGRKRLETTFKYDYCFGLLYPVPTGFIEVKSEVF